MKAENLIDKRQYPKLSYHKLREIEQERIILELGIISLGDRIIITKNIKKIMNEMGWF